MNPETLGTEEGLDYWRERETQVMELTSTYGWDALVEIAKAEIEFKKRRLLGGHIDTHEGYLRLAAEIRGAEFVLELPERISQTVKDYRRLLAEQSADSGT